MKALRNIINKSKLLSINSNFTLQVSKIDATELKPVASDMNLLVDVYAVAEPDLLTKFTFNNDGFATTFFSFNIGKGLPKSYTPLGIKILGKSIYMTHNGNFTGLNNEVWKELRPTLDQKNHELGYWVPTAYYKLLSELQDRKIFLEFPAICEKSSGRIYGAIPTYGNLIGYLREKRVI
jgi:hypothetical protein